MSALNTSLTKSDFDQCSWKDVIDRSERKECSTYSSLFFAKAKELEASNNTKEQAVYVLLGAITSMFLKLDVKDQPFAPEIVFTTFRSAMLEDISDEHLDVLIDVAPEVSDPEMRARISDILWVRRRDFRMAQLAVDAYLESATILEDPQNWVACATRIERTVQIAAYLGKNSEFFLKTIAYIEEVLERYRGEDPLFLSAKMMELLLEYRKGDPTKYTEFAEKAASRAEANLAWHVARAYWKLQARWYARKNDTVNERTALEAEAETYFKEAQSSLNGTNPSYSVASRHIVSAIEALRNIGREQERIGELRAMLLDYQQKAVSEMKPIAISFDGVNADKEAREQVKGKTLEEALFALALMFSSPKVDSIRKQVQDAANKFPLQHILSTELINDKGRTTARRPSMLMDESDTYEAAVRAEMFIYARKYQSVLALVSIEPARDQILLEHNARIQDLLPIVYYNPFVPNGREYIFARGLHAGLIGDFLVAAHLLVPQLENSIRHLLYQHGEIVSQLDSQGIQDEIDLNAIFYTFRKVLINILDEDVVFDLQGLLIERFGSNLRNVIAHGLANHDSLLSGQVSYLWWITLRLCCLFRLVPMIEKGQQATQESQGE